METEPLNKPSLHECEDTQNIQEKAAKVSKRCSTRRTRNATPSVDGVVVPELNENGGEHEANRDQRSTSHSPVQNEIVEDAVAPSHISPRRENRAITSPQNGELLKHSSTAHPGSSAHENNGTDSEQNSPSVTKSPKDNSRKGKDRTIQSKRRRDESQDDDEDERIKKKTTSSGRVLSTSEGIATMDNNNDLVTVGVLKTHISVLTEAVGSVATSVRVLQDQLHQFLAKTPAVVSDLSGALNGHEKKAESQSQSCVKSAQGVKSEGVNQEVDKEGKS